MTQKPIDESYSEIETERRMREAVRRALTTPPKPAKKITGKGRMNAQSMDIEKRQDKP